MGLAFTFEKTAHEHHLIAPHLTAALQEHMTVPRIVIKVNVGQMCNQRLQVFGQNLKGFSTKTRTLAYDKRSQR